MPSQQRFPAYGNASASPVMSGSGGVAVALLHPQSQPLSHAPQVYHDPLQDAKKSVEDFVKGQAAMEAELAQSVRLIQPSLLHHQLLTGPTESQNSGLGGRDEGDLFACGTAPELSDLLSQAKQTNA